MFSIGQEVVREKYHFAKSRKSQGILTVPRHKVKRTFEWIFHLVQAWLKVLCWQRLVFCGIFYRCSVLYRCWILYRCSHHRPSCEWCDIWRLTTLPGSTSPTLFRPMVWVFNTSHKNQISVSALRRDLRFFVRIREDWKSNRLQMSLQRQHFLLSYLKTLRFEPFGVRTRNLPLSRPALSQLS